MDARVRSTDARVRAMAPRGVAVAFLASGVLHFLAPKPYEAIVPRVLPRRRLLVQVSGAAELVCAAGLLARARWAGPTSAALLVAVFPANVQMALDSGSGRLPGLADNRVVAWGRLPLQVPLIWAALQAPQVVAPRSAAGATSGGNASNQPSTASS